MGIRSATRKIRRHAQVAPEQQTPTQPRLGDSRSSGCGGAGHPNLGRRVASHCRKNWSTTEPRGCPTIRRLSCDTTPPNCRPSVLRRVSQLQPAVTVQSLFLNDLGLVPQGTHNDPWMCSLHSPVRSRRLHLRAMRRTTSSGINKTSTIATGALNGLQPQPPRVARPPTRRRRPR